MSIIKNSVWNLFGYAIPTLIAIPSLGFLARGLGPEGFGVYTIAIALVGYAGIFDVGLTRSVIREIAIHRDNHHERTSAGRALAACRSWRVGSFYSPANRQLPSPCLYYYREKGDASLQRE